MEAVGTLAGGVAHDFNNILTGILGYASLLRQEMEAGSPLSADVEAIAGSARRAAELTQQLLTFSRRSPQVETAAVDVNGIVKEIAFLLGRTFDKSISVEIVLDPRGPAVEGNAGQLHQAILNLCLNARDAMPRGGRLRIQTGTAAASGRGRERGERVFIRVSDTGTGMPQAVRDHLFEPFFTTKESGRGLGLAMVYGIVRGHEGEIAVQSEQDAGTTFEISLPLSDRKAESASSAAAPSRKRGSETVLVVDDEETVRIVLKRILERDGYTVMLAEDGIVGVGKFRADPRAVSLVILDMAMPRMDGSEAFEAMMAVDPAARILISSGYSEEGRAADLLRKGAKGFLRKPYANDVVLNMVRGILDA
jgi:two-component system, cell cycle sensor histidine kinase and response regulator CckA